jgi:hypothetical protein
MPADYHLKLVNVTPHIRRNTATGVLAIGGVACGIYVLAHRLYPASDSAIALAMLALAVGFVLGIIAYLKATLIPSLVSVGATELRVRDLRRNHLLHCIDYADIVAYRHQIFDGTEELRLTLHNLTLHNNERVSLKSAANLDTANEFADMARAFEQQLAQAAAATTARGSASPRSSAGLPVRQKGFLEKPLATGLLLAATLVAGLLSWQVAAGNLTVGNVAGALVLYISYSIAWLTARRRA